MYCQSNSDFQYENGIGSKRHERVGSVRQILWSINGFDLVAAGVFLLLKANTFFNMPDYYSVPLGLVLTLYGAFRGYRIYKKYFDDRHENDN